MKLFFIPRRATGIVLALLVLAVSGCASRYDVRVDAIARVGAPLDGYASYEIRPGNPRLAKDGTRYQDAANCIRTALAGHALFEAPAGTRPDLIVEIDYGMDAPRAKPETISVPIYGRGGPNETSRASNPALEDSEPRAGRRADLQPQLRVVGHREETRYHVVREKYLVVRARENRAGGEGRPAQEVFDVRVAAEDESSDLRHHLPILAAAAMNKMGQTTDGTVGARLAADDPSAAFIRAGR
jgi:hypothetical protein